MVAICQLSSAAINSTQRAALVARDLGAALHILHPQPAARVLTRVQATLGELVEDIRARTRVDVVVEPVAGDFLARAVALSREAAMVVLPSVRGNPLREWILGTPAERLIRLCRCPVLVVKRPAVASYRRLLVPIDLEWHVLPLLDLAGSLSWGSHPQVLHVLDDESVRQDMADAQSALRGGRQRRARQVHQDLDRLIAASKCRGTGFRATVAFGSAPEVIGASAREGDVDLTVLGKRRRGLLANYVLGGTTQRVLGEASSDVLVHPSRENARCVPSHPPVASPLTHRPGWFRGGSSEVTP